MNAFPFNEGYFKYGEWLLVWVEIENRGSDVKSTVEVRITGSGGTVVYARLVDLPINSRKRIPLYVLPNNYSRELDVRLLTDARIITQQKITLHPQLNNTYIVGMLTEKRGALSLINGARIPLERERQLILVDLQPNEFPEKVEALKSVDALVVNNLDTTQLTKGQSNAIEAWVEQGGVLVLGGGSGSLRTVAGFPADLVPFTVEGLDELHELDQFVKFSMNQEPHERDLEPAENPILVPGPFLVASGTVPTGQVLIQQGEFPILVGKHLGKGTVYFSALDLSTSPFDAWNGTTHFWENLLSPGAMYPDWIPPDVSNRQQLAGQMPYTLTNLPMLDLPSTRLLAFWLLLYILLIGPVNYLILRWKNRLHLAWITIPALTLVFSVGAFGLGHALRGSDIFINIISVIELSGDGKAHANSFIGVFSPAQEAYEVEVSGNGLISSMSPFNNPWDSSLPAGNFSGRELRLVQGEPTSIQGMSIEQWSMHSFMVEGIEFETGGLKHTLHIDDTILTGRIKNISGFEIKDALILLNKSITRLGDLQPDQEIPISIPVSDQSNLDFGSSISYLIFQDQLNQPDPDNPPDRELEVRRQIVETLFERLPPYQFSTTQMGRSGSGIKSTPVFLGWIDDAPTEVIVHDSQPGKQSTSILVMPLEFELPQGNVILPAGWIPGEMIQSPVDGGTCGEPGSTSVFLNRGEGIFRFSIPDKFKSIKPEKIRLSIWSDSGVPQSPAEVSVINWLTETWITLSGVQTGVNLIPQAGSFIDASGEIRIKISTGDTGQGCYFLAVGLEGFIP